MKNKVALLCISLFMALTSLSPLMGQSLPQPGGLHWSLPRGPFPFADAVSFRTNKPLGLPARDTAAVGGFAFCRHLDSLDATAREAAIVQAVLSGNIPDSLRHFRALRYRMDGHDIILYFLPDYVAVGDNRDFVRMPMTPLSAQRIADALDCSLPTKMLVDAIACTASGGIEPFAFYPKGERNTFPYVFEDHARAVAALFRAAGYHFGALINGIKKDVVLSGSCRKGRVAIYGWYKLDGTPIQPLYGKHFSRYVDYSHGIRLIANTVVIDHITYDYREILSHPTLFRLLSDEEEPLRQAFYNE